MVREPGRRDIAHRRPGPGSDMHLIAGLSSSIRNGQAMGKEKCGIVDDDKKAAGGRVGHRADDSEKAGPAPVAYRRGDRLLEPEADIVWCVKRSECTRCTAYQSSTAVQESVSLILTAVGYQAIHAPGVQARRRPNLLPNTADPFKTVARTDRHHRPGN